MSEEQIATDTQSSESISMADFLENTPPLQHVSISPLVSQTPYGNSYLYDLRTPEIQLHCSDNACNGTRFFRYSGESIRLRGDAQTVFLNYICSNCQKAIKIFSIWARREKGSTYGEGFKFGEYPAFGPPVPSRLISMIGPDRDLFLQGRRCENQGMGIGAFVYYRRVVEDQKNRILDEIIKVAKKVNAPDTIITDLEGAKSENQFGKALDAVEVPQTLLVNGHNPLKLLHSALSEGLHTQTDAECLHIARSVRVVLGELAEKLSQALKDEAELQAALSTLMNKKESTD